MGYVIPVLLFLLAAGIVANLLYNFWGNIKAKKEQNERLQERWRQIPISEAEYKAALAGTSKVEALEKGRAFYTIVRDGELTIMDETQMANDINVRSNLR